MTNVKIIEVKAKPFSTESIGTYSFRVDLDCGDITVFDSVAECYTSCHSMSKSQIRRIQRLAGYVAFPFGLRIAAGYHGGSDRLGDLVSRHRTFLAAQDAAFARQDCEIVYAAFDGSFYRS